LIRRLRTLDASELEPQCVTSSLRRRPGSICGSITGTTSRRQSAPAVSFCSGMLPVDPQTGERRHGTLASEAHVIFGNLKLLLESAGSSLDRLVQVHALIYDSIEYDVLNRVYRQYVANGPPARTVWAAQIEAGFKVELDVIAAA
jgi:2-iminobutanoate/2-iminopropanoate deaminase